MVLFPEKELADLFVIRKINCIFATLSRSINLKNGNRMAKYAIYKFTMEETTEGTLFSANTGERLLDRAQDMLEEVLGTKEGLPVRKLQRGGTEIALMNYRLAGREGVTVWVVCNERYTKYQEGLEQRRLEYHPGCRVIIDNREGVGQMAIEYCPAFDNDPDRVRSLLENALNRALEERRLRMEILAKVRPADFWNDIHVLCHGHKDRISKVSFHFPELGKKTPVDASGIWNEKLRLMNVLAAALGAERGNLTFGGEEGKLKFDETSEDLAQIVDLCCNNAYDISVHFSHYGVYRSTKTVKAFYDLPDDAVDEFISGQRMMGRDGFWLITSLNEARIFTTRYQDEEKTGTGRKGVR